MAKRKNTGIGARLFGYGFGFLSWFAGCHCFEEDSKGNTHLLWHKILRHLIKVFLTAAGIAFLFRLLGGLASGVKLECYLVGLTLLVFLLYVRVLAPHLFTMILPGTHVFLCPQCYRRQVFKFLPVSFRYGFWVTYLCPNCFCLVNGWGEQIFYPARSTFKKLAASLAKSIPLVLAATALAIAGGEILSKKFLCL